MKTPKLLFALCFAIPFGILLGLGLECLLNLMGILMSVSLDSDAVSLFPRFIPFCIVVGGLSLAAIVVLSIVNVRLSDRIGYTKALWIFQVVAAILLSLPLIKVFEMLFDLLQKSF